ncbi:MAG: hypothetical protein JNN13_15600, partial [Planctomycetes bacterium]|nr:hypothetical protein [Planctomycetota bacterium]
MVRAAGVGEETQRRDFCRYLGGQTAIQPAPRLDGKFALRLRQFRHAMLCNSVMLRKTSLPGLGPILPSVFVFAVSAGAIAAQCGTQWSALSGVPGVAGPSVRAATRWDPDGAGPSPELVVLGGDFAGASMTLSPRVVSYEPLTETWAPLGAGVDGLVEAFAVLPNGELVVAGAFANAGNVAASRVARWNGATWSALGTGIGSGLNTDVRACVTMPNGDLIVGGSFTVAGGVAASNIARWD